MLNTYNVSSYTPTSYKIYLFGRSSTSGTLDDAGNSRIYKVKIWDGNLLIRNMVPCYRKNDSVAGMYDLANGVFYTNAGSGTFGYIP